jgi:hypothetical protein
MMQIVIEVKNKDLGRKILNILSLFHDDGIIIKEVIPATSIESFVEKLRETVGEFPHSKVNFKEKWHEHLDRDVEISGEISDEYIDKHWMQLAMTDVDFQADDDDILEEAYIEYLEETKDANLG